MTASAFPQAPEDAAAAHAGKDQSPAQRHWLRIVLPVWAAIYALLVAVNFSGLSARKFHDPDDQLRLQQVRDLLAGQNWFDLHQYRIDTVGGGVLMHWSRLVDAPIAAVVLAARPFLGQHGAETAALVIVPGLTLLAILALVGWMAARTLPRAALPTALIAVGFAVPVMVQVLPARIDHHGWQIVLALAAVAAFLDPRERRGGWLTGAALAGWMAISFEGLPLSAWIITVLALAALFDVGLRARLVAAMQALAMVSATLFAAMRGWADLGTHCDAIAPVHIAAFAWGAAAITLANALRPDSKIALLAGLGVAALGAVAIVAGVAPQCTGGSFDMLDPVVRTMWYDNVQEGKPVWATEWHLAVQYALPPLIGLLAAVRLALVSDGGARRWWTLYALILGGALAVGLVVARAASISTVLAALPLGWQLSTWLAALRRPPNPLLRMAELVGVALVIFVVLLPVVPVLAVEKLLDSDPGVAEPARSPRPCSARLAGPAIAGLPPGGILAPLDMGPDILISTDRHVLATGHHRGAKAMRLTIDAFSGSADQARTIMTLRDLRYLATCDSVQELDLYRKRSPEGFASQLVAGRIPRWLEPVAMPAASGIRMWRRVD